MISIYDILIMHKEYYRLIMPQGVKHIEDDNKNK